MRHLSWHISSTFSCSRARDSFKFSFLFSHWSLITQVISSVNAIFHQRQKRINFNSQYRVSSLDKTYFSHVWFLPESLVYSLHLKTSDAPRSTTDVAMTPYCSLSCTDPLRFLPLHFLTPSPALWVIYQLLIFHVASTTLPLPVLLSVLKPTC